VCPSGNAVGCLVLWRLRPLLSIYSTSRLGFFNSLFCGEGLQAYVAWSVPPADVFSAAARSHCKQLVVFAVFKALCGDDVCRCLFPLLPFQCIFQVSVDDEQSNEEDD